MHIRLCIKLNLFCKKKRIGRRNPKCTLSQQRHTFLSPGRISFLFKRLNSHLSVYIVLNLVTVTKTSNSTLNCNFKGSKYKRYESKIWVKQQKHEFLKGLSHKHDLKHDNDTSTGISAAMQS